MNLARALHALEEYDAAIDATRRALAGDDDALAARAYYQLGVHHFRARGSGRGAQRLHRGAAA